MFKVTFSNEPEKNGSSTTWPTSLKGCLTTISEYLEVAVKRETPTQIIVEVRGREAWGLPAPPQA